MNLFSTVNNAKIERARAPFDMTNGIKVNAIYDLPLGRGHLVNLRPLEPVRVAGLQAVA